MNDDDPGLSGLDLSGLPEPMRSMVRNQLAKMPAPLREKLLREGSPLLDRMVAKARARVDASGTTPLPRSAAESGSSKIIDLAKQAQDASRRRALETRPLATVSPGDSPWQGIWLLVAAIVVLALLWHAMRG